MKLEPVKKKKNLVSKKKKKKRKEREVTWMDHHSIPTIIFDHMGTTQL